jgi:hypothetical protein
MPSEKAAKASSWPLSSSSVEIKSGAAVPLIPLYISKM